MESTVAGIGRFITLLLILTVLAVASFANLAVGAEARSESQENRLGANDGFAPTDNSVLEFSAAGSNGRDYLQVTAQGGTVKLSGIEYRVWPWHYVRGDFATGPMWIIFLANVTSDNFRIMFLYLTNQTTVFGLRIFNYETGVFETRPFQGNHFVSETVVPAPRPPPVALNIIPESKTGSDFSALGAKIYVHDRVGYAYEGEQQLTIYPIYNQVFAEEGKYNELWAIVRTSDNNLYYSIFYVQNGRDTTIYRGHTLRLNDFAYMNWNTYEARWTKGEFPGELRLRTDLGGLLVWLDGFPFAVPSDGSLKVAVPIGPLSVKIQDAVQVSNGVRKAFSKWNDGSQENPRLLQVDGTSVLAASYKQQYLVTVDGVPAPSNFTGWYDEGSQVEFQVPSVIEYGNGTRNMFTGWSGDLQSDQTSLRIVADSPKHVEAKWQLQYLLTVEVHGLPDGTALVIDFNGSPQTVTVGVAFNEWIDSGSTINVEPSERAVVLNGEEFTLESWTSQDSTPISMPISMTSPTTIRANYRSVAVYESNVSMQASRTTLPLGQTVEVAGRLSPSVPGAEVLLFVSHDNQTWTQIGQAITSIDGSFSFQWTPTAKGTYYVQARWVGNNERRGSLSPIQALNVIEYDEPISQPLSSVREKIQQISKSSPGVNTAYVLLAGPALAVFDISEKVAPSLSTNPVLSQVIYFTIAGLLLGLIYLLPPAFIVSVVRTMRRGRAAGPKGSMIALILWVLTLAAGFAFAFGVFAIGSATLTILALATMTVSAVLLPLMFSYAVAHIIRP